MEQAGSVWLEQVSRQFLWTHLADGTVATVIPVSAAPWCSAFLKEELATTVLLCPDHMRRVNPVSGNRVRHKASERISRKAGEPEHLETQPCQTNGHIRFRTAHLNLQAGGLLQTPESRGSQPEHRFTQRYH